MQLGSTQLLYVSTRSIDWYSTLASTTYYTRVYPCTLMVALFSWVVAP
jgi:hypothetical protein